MSLIVAVHHGRLHDKDLSSHIPPLHEHWERKRSLYKVNVLNRLWIGPRGAIWDPALCQGGVSGPITYQDFYSCNGQDIPVASCHSGHSRVQDILSIGPLVKQGEEGKWILPQTQERAQPCRHRETRARVGIRNWKRVHASSCVATCYSVNGKLMSALATKRNENPVCVEELNSGGSKRLWEADFLGPKKKRSRLEAVKNT